MIGRHRAEGALAEVGPWRVARVAIAGALTFAAILTDHLIAGSQPLVIGLSTGALLLSAGPIVWGALRGLLRLETNVDELVSLAIMASIVLGEWTSAAVVSVIMVLGSLIEELTSERARRHLERLGASSPDHAILIEEGGELREVQASTLRPGQLVLVRPGDVVAADGVVVQGESELDESMLTGESLPVVKRGGDHLAAGTVNTHGALHLRVDRVGAESTQGRILRIVQEAERHRAPILRVAERYAKWFTPTILVLAGAVWLLTGDVHRAVTMLIVGCPCAFVLATPTAVMAALDAASRQGVLVKGGRYLEACAAVRVVAFDKTGTLTEGAFGVSAVLGLGASEAEVLGRAAALEQGAEHPLAAAILARARAEGLALEPCGATRRVAGLGVTEIEGGPRGPLRAGSLRFLEGEGVAIDGEARAKAEGLERGGRTVVALAEGRELLGLIALEDRLRAESAAVLDELRRDGLQRLIMVSGDVPGVARPIAERLGLPEGAVHAQRLPEQKYALIAELERAGERVCYVGDGTNDGPALAVASVGVSIGSRENTVALETADAVLMRGGLARLPFLLRLGRETTRTINQNLIAFGLLFNLLLLTLSATGALTPILGAIGHNLGSVAVVLNSARLLRIAPARSGGERTVAGEVAAPPERALLT